MTRPRANFTLDEPETKLLHAMQDAHERAHGFRPAMSQIVAGLIRKATPTTPREDQP